MQLGFKGTGHVLKAIAEHVAKASRVPAEDRNACGSLLLQPASNSSFKSASFAPAMTATDLSVEFGFVAASEPPSGVPLRSDFPGRFVSFSGHLCLGWACSAGPAAKLTPAKASCHSLCFCAGRRFTTAHPAPLHLVPRPWSSFSGAGPRSTSLKGDGMNV